MAEDRLDASEKPSRRGPARSRGSAPTTGLGPKQFPFKRVGFIKREVAGPAAICNRLSNERRPEVAGMGVANRARWRGDRHAFDALLVARVEIGIVEDQMLRRGAADAKPRGQRQVDFGRARVRQAMDRERRFVGDHAVRVWSTHLRPQGGLHVLPERRDRVSSEPIDAAGDSFNVAALMELGQAHLQHARFQGLCSREAARLWLGELVERRVPLPAFHPPTAMSII